MYKHNLNLSHHQFEHALYLSLSIVHSFFKTKIINIILNLSQFDIIMFTNIQSTLHALFLYNLVSNKTLLQCVGDYKLREEICY